MTLGEGIFWSTLLIIAFLAIVLIFKAGAWKLVGKCLAVILGLIAVCVFGYWIYGEYENRPYKVTGLGGANLGDTRVDIKLALGAPDSEYLTENGESVHSTYDSTSGALLLAFRELDGQFMASTICSNRTRDRVFGLGTYTTETSVIEHLGQPDKTSVAADGFEKMISYEDWLVSFEVSRGTVQRVCVSDKGYLTYLDEYDSDNDLISGEN